MENWQRGGFLAKFSVDKRVPCLVELSLADCVSVQMLSSSG